VPLKEFPPEEWVTCEQWWDDLRQYVTSLLPDDGETVDGQPGTEKLPPAVDADS
jgi:hypothetical protein